ncbi:hypothetical protein C9374_006076 [Naegleria lovaniensis]|uniref:Uncharacterized protein n=1 Tax=Naegleria lovaniensis TaxID=51637 RepID=A0AA88KI04_NAELO|nr:uncharacterized protein C9374_006076 [Naegleria lovaniensis]KAG2381692.1 hypothetical protein C9374_006076 [Naegleria lovaniensis]
MPSIKKAKRASKAEESYYSSPMTESNIDALLQYVAAKKNVGMKVTTAIKLFAQEYNFDPNHARSSFYAKVKSFKEQSGLSTMNVFPDDVSRMNDDLLSAIRFETKQVE